MKRWFLSWLSFLLFLVATTGREASAAERPTPTFETSRLSVPPLESPRLPAASILPDSTHLPADSVRLPALTVRLSRGRHSVYQWLGQITHLTGYLFIYDSRTIDNERIVRLPAGDYLLAEAIRRITGNDHIRSRIIGNHILLQTPGQPPADTAAPDTLSVAPAASYYTIQGRLQDRYSGEPIAYGSIGLKEVPLGTISNQNGEFRLLISDTLGKATVLFSHLGYRPEEMNSEQLRKGHLFITLEPKVIPIQEVVIRRANPLKLIQAMRAKIETNYSGKSVYHTTFYREGVEQKKKFVSLTEAVFKIRKTPYDRPGGSDQVKLLKMRKISNRQEKDTLITKMKSGIWACLYLDVVKHFPDFLEPGAEELYQYAHTDMTVVDDRLANVISFEQREGIDTPLYKGLLYMDTENDALIRAEFEINPRFIRKAAGMLVEKKSRELNITPSRVMYSVTYKLWNGTYYIHHLRGDLHFKIKKRRQFFNTTPLHTWFEMVTCKTDTFDSSRFSRAEALPTRTIFSDTDFTYDAAFWKHFNVILPEEKLSDAIEKISSKIEETGE